MIRARRSHRPRAGALVASGGIAVALAVGLATPGSAGAATEAGWWMAPLAIAPDAPADGLVVQGGPAGPVAYGAVHFAVTPAAEPESLLLQVAPDTASTPNTSLVLCPLTEPFTPVQGGAMADAPAYDCERSVEAAASDDGTTYTFEVAALVDGDALAVAILPTAPTDRVVLSAPADYSLTASGPGEAPPTIGTFPPVAPPSGTLELPPSEVPIGGSPSFPPIATPTPEAPAPQGAPPPIATSPVSLDDVTGGESWLRTVLVLGSLSIAAGLWTAAGAEREDEVSPPAALA